MPEETKIAERPIYDLKAAAEYMRIPVSTLRFHVREGHLPFVKFPKSRRYYLRLSDMRDFIDKNTHIIE